MAALRWRWRSRASASSRRRWRSRWWRCSATSSTAAPRPRPAVSAYASRSAARPAPPTTSRTRGSSASPRQWSSACGWGSISRHRSAREAFASRYALPIWADFMQRAARIRAPGTFERPAGLHEETLCAEQLSAARGGLSALHRVLQGRRRGPRGTVPAASRQHPPAGCPRGAGLGGRGRPAHPRHLQVTSTGRAGASGRPSD